MEQYDVTALGELLIDFAPYSTNEAGYPVLSANPGGAPGNFLAALSRYGCKTAMIGKVGADSFGRALIGTLQEAGIDTRGTEEVDEALIADTKVFHFGTLSLTDEPAAQATRHAVGLAKSHGTLISLDPNLRKPLWRREEDARKAIEWSLRQADIVKISDDEISFLWGLEPEAGAKKLLNEYGVRLVYATMGPRGCHAETRNAVVTVGSPEGIKTVDTTGAGDIFGGSAMSRYLKTGKAPEDLTEQELHDIAAFACTAASLSTRKHGGISSVPDEQEVLARI